MIKRDVKINIFYLKIVQRLFFEDFESENECIRQRLLEMQSKIRSTSMLDDSLNFDENQYVTYQRIISNFFFVTVRESRKTDFFVTDSEETNKSFLLHILVS